MRDLGPFINAIEIKIDMSDIELERQEKLTDFFCTSSEKDSS